jgi:hypothetical protein
MRYYMRTLPIHLAIFGSELVAIDNMRYAIGGRFEYNKVS